MKTRTFVSALAAAAGLASMASAQVTQQGTISISFAFQEVDAVTYEPVAAPNGTIDSGEAAAISMTVNFTGFNTVASFSPSIGTFGSGTIRGFGSAIVDLNGSANAGGNANGAWLLDGTGPASAAYTTGLQGNFGASNGPGTPNGTGSSLINIQPGQFPPNAGLIDTHNNTIVWYGVWTPSSYAARTVTFASAPGSVVGAGNFAALLLRLNTALAGSANIPNANVTLGSVNIPVAPAPSSIALLGLGALVAARRRR